MFFFEFDFSMIDSNSNAITFFDSTSAYILTPLAIKPTRITNPFQTLNDNVFVSKAYTNVAGIFTFE